MDWTLTLTLLKYIDMNPKSMILKLNTQNKTTSLLPPPYVSALLRSVALEEYGGFPKPISKEMPLLARTKWGSASDLYCLVQRKAQTQMNAHLKTDIFSIS